MKLSTHLDSGCPNLSIFSVWDNLTLKHINAQYYHQVDFFHQSLPKWTPWPGLLIWRVWILIRKCHKAYILQCREYAKPTTNQLIHALVFSLGVSFVVAPLTCQIWLRCFMDPTFALDQLFCLSVENQVPWKQLCSCLLFAAGGRKGSREFLRISLVFCFCFRIIRCLASLWHYNNQWFLSFPISSESGLCLLDICLELVGFTRWFRISQLAQIWASILITLATEPATRHYRLLVPNDQTPSRSPPKQQGRSSLVANCNASGIVMALHLFFTYKKIVMPVEQEFKIFLDL